MYTSKRIVLSIHDGEILYLNILSSACELTCETEEIKLKNCSAVYKQYWTKKFIKFLGLKKYKRSISITFENFALLKYVDTTNWWYLPSYAA